MSSLENLAREYIATAEKLADVRRRLAAALRGSDPAPRSAARPTRPAKGPAKRPEPAKSTKRDAILAEAAKAEDQIVDLLKEKPGLRHAAIVRELGTKATSTSAGLERLSAKGLIQRDAEGAWSSTSSPPPTPSAI
jgi:hypothetical protein